MRKTFLLTSILLLSASWALAQYSSGSSQTDQQSTSGSQSTGAYSGSSAGSQTTTTDDVSPGAQPSSSDSSNQSSSDQNAPQSRGGYTSSPGGTSQTQGTRSESMSSQQGETSSDMSSQDMSSQSGSQTGTSTRTSAKAGGRTMTVQGCLSEANGKFHLTDKMGTSYELTGKTANLKAHVGHTVSITGKSTTSGANQPGAMSGEQAGMEQTIQVSSFKHVSASCKSGSMSSPGATGSSPHTY